jgi:pimeloyl-ACP methyl ester carboxylesterase
LPNSAHCFDFARTRQAPHRRDRHGKRRVNAREIPRCVEKAESKDRAHWPPIEYLIGPAPMTKILLVHGSSHGAWCWEKIVPLLRRAGYEVETLDLPAHGADKTPWWRTTLGRYSNAVREVARKRDGNVVLVGHSMGGGVITQAAAQEPGLFKGLIYLAGFVPKVGETMLGLARRDAVWRGFAVPRYRFGTITVWPDRTKDTFYNACSPADAQAAAARLCPEPIPPLLQPIAKGCEECPPRAFIETRQDRTISLDLQRWMHRRFDMKRVATLDTDHSPFYSAPGELSEKIAELAADF